MRLLLIILTCVFFTQVQAQTETTTEIQKHPLDSNKFTIARIESDTLENFYSIDYSPPMDSIEAIEYLFNNIESKKINLFNYKKLIKEAEAEIEKEEKEVKKVTKKNTKIG